MRRDCESVRGDCEPVSEMACVRTRERSGVRREKERERLNVYVWLVKNKRAKRHSFGIK